MDSKKNEDYTVKMPEYEMRDYSGRSSPSSKDSFISRSNSNKAGGIIPVSNITNSPPISILAYCLASISMTVTNKYVVSGTNWNLNFFYLAIQVCHTPTKSALDGGILTTW
jgi:GDP-mannose transporter